MPDYTSSDSFVELYIFETEQNIEQLEQLVIAQSEAGKFSKKSIQEIFRLMHTVKGSSAMMNYHGIATVAHRVEDLFSYIRENSKLSLDSSSLSDLVLSGIDFIKGELEKIKAGGEPDGDASGLAEDIQNYLNSLKSSQGKPAADADDSEAAGPAAGGTGQAYEATVFFEDGCQMENVRAFELIHRLNNVANNIRHIPEELMENDDSAEKIIKNGFQVFFYSDRPFEEVQAIFTQTLFLKDYTLQQVKSPSEEKTATRSKAKAESATHSIATSNIISVHISKLDRLLDLAGEIVITEAMLTQSPDLAGLELPHFRKTAQQFRKIIDELQDLIMSVRLVPLTITFQKMNRIVYDMNKRLNKEAQLVLVGEDTEVDKNIIEHISDPLMHLVRNAVDHGIESPEERRKKNKPPQGTITLSAKNEGGEVIIEVSDDGRGFDKESIIRHAQAKNLLTRPPEEMTEKEIYSLIFLPGFSTKDEVSEFSGRGVGMDVVVKNIQEIGGTIHMESEPDAGSKTIIRIPLTLAIISGMNTRVGDGQYAIPIKEIRESFRPQKRDIIVDPDGREMVMVRGQCYPVVRLHRLFNLKPASENLWEGILIMVEREEKTTCLFVDELLGEQQMVVKALPKYMKGIKGISACTLLGDGSISLILDVGVLF